MRTPRTLIGVFALIIATTTNASAEPRTLEELLADERGNAVDIGIEQNRRNALEAECDCVIEHGVKIHGYPGAWSRRNRINRANDIDINLDIQGLPPPAPITNETNTNVYVRPQNNVTVPPYSGGGGYYYGNPYWRHYNR